MNAVKAVPRQKTSATGTFTRQGFNTGYRYSEITLNDTTWTALPATALTDRNVIALYNRSGIEIVVNSDATDPLPGGIFGFPIEAGVERQYDAKDDVVLYAKSLSGTPTISVEELA